MRLTTINFLEKVQEQYQLNQIYFLLTRRRPTSSRTCKPKIATVMQWNVTQLHGKDVVRYYTGLHRQVK